MTMQQIVSDNDMSLKPIRDHLAALDRAQEKERNARKTTDAEIIERLDNIMKMLEGKKKFNPRFDAKGNLISIFDTFHANPVSEEKNDV